MLLQFVQKFADAVQGFLDMLGGVAIGGADKAFATQTERRAGDNGNMLAVKQFFAEFLGGHAGALNAGEGVEGALRLAAG